MDTKRLTHYRYFMTKCTCLEAYGKHCLETIKSINILDEKNFEDMKSLNACYAEEQLLLPIFMSKLLPSLVTSILRAVKDFLYQYQQVFM